MTAREYFDHRKYRVTDEQIRLVGARYVSTAARQVTDLLDRMFIAAGSQFAAATTHRWNAGDVEWLNRHMGQGRRELKMAADERQRMSNHRAAVDIEEPDADPSDDEVVEYLQNRELKRAAALDERAVEKAVDAVALADFLSDSGTMAIDIRAQARALHREIRAAVDRFMSNIGDTAPTSNHRPATSNSPAGRRVMTPPLADYFRDLGSRGGPVEAWLVCEGQMVSLRLKRGNEISDHGPRDVLPSGMPADELILAWIDPVARAELKHHGFFVGGFADASAAGIALAKRFLSQPPPSPADRPVGEARWIDRCKGRATGNFAARRYTMGGIDTVALNDVLELLMSEFDYWNAAEERIDSAIVIGAVAATSNVIAAMSGHRCAWHPQPTTSPSTRSRAGSPDGPDAVNGCE